MTHEISTAETPAQIMRCFPAMAEIRPHLARDEFVSRVQRQQQTGYHLTYLEAGGEVLAVAGWRLLDSLSRGRFLYVDDLATRSIARRRGCASALFDWLARRGLAEGCLALHLDSGHNREDAHRFYTARRMAFSARHYQLNLRAS